MKSSKKSHEKEEEENEDEEKNEDEEERDHDSDDDEAVSPLTSLDVNIPRQRPAVSVVNKGPKKLILKKKKTPKEPGDNDEEERQGEMVRLIRGKMNREFVLFKSDNFNFSVKRRGERSDLVHHFSRVETYGPSRLPSSLLVKPLLNR